MIITIIIIIAAIFRFYGLNWDQGQHLHPDERMITMVADKLTLDDPNPHFFAYGSLPIYLLKIASTLAGNFDPTMATFEKINLVGRFLSGLFDMGTILTLYFLGKKLLNQNLGLLSAFFYSISVLPIQLSHFYAVDTPLTFFVLITLYFLVKLQGDFKFHNTLLCGLFLGLSLATKTSAILLTIPVFIVFLSKLITHISKRESWLNLAELILLFVILGATAILSFMLTEPYAVIDFQTFWQQTLQQAEMTKDAFIFPYTLQYVGKIPYLYELKNIFFWGLGPLLASLAFVGTLFTTYRAFRPSLDSRLLTLVTFFIVYFAVVGNFAIGFMRYMLPLYPLLCLFTAIFLTSVLSSTKSHFPKLQPLLLTTYYLLLASLLLWPISFISIYSQPNTRNQATAWINSNIPVGATIATEHWDDGLPIGTQSNYQVLTMPMYDPDTPSKWALINAILDQTQYIIIASNRLYTPLQKLTDCPNLPPGKCYTQTADYYQKLFNGSLGFTKVAEFAVHPALTIYHIPYTIYDSSADESFTVYDHPRVMIFKKM